MFIESCQSWVNSVVLCIYLTTTNERKRININLRIRKVMYVNSNIIMNCYHEWVKSWWRASNTDISMDISNNVEENFLQPCANWPSLEADQPPFWSTDQWVTLVGGVFSWITDANSDSSCELNWDTIATQAENMNDCNDNDSSICLLQYMLSRFRSRHTLIRVNGLGQFGWIPERKKYEWSWMVLIMDMSAI